MSNRLFDQLWREAVSELVEHLETEHPEEAAAAPKTLADWARLYIRYLQTARKLADVHAGLVQPQKRQAARAALDACLGRMLELRPWLATLNGKPGPVDLEPYLLETGLTPDVLELPLPHYMRADCADALAARGAAIAAACAAGPPPEAALAVAAAEADAAAEDSADSDSEAGSRATIGAAVAGQVSSPAASLQSQRQQQPFAHDVSPEEQALQAEAAARRIQASVRGWLARRAVRAEAAAERLLLGMQRPAGAGSAAAAQAAALAAAEADRAAKQAAQRAEYDAALLAVKDKVRRHEGYAMREAIQDKLNDWLLKSRDPDTGDYPNLPEEAAGGSAAIVRPLPPPPSAEAAAAAAKAAAAAAAKAKARAGGKGSKVPRPPAAFVRDLRAAVQTFLDGWQDWEARDPGAAALPPELQGLPPPRGAAAEEAPDLELIRAEVRPVVEEEVRREADADMRRLIQGIRDLLDGARAQRAKAAGGKKGKQKGAGAGAGSGKKGGGKGKDGGEGAGGKKGGSGGAADRGGKGEAAAAAAGPSKRRKDPSAGRSVESILAELAASGLVRLPPPVPLSAYLGGPCLVRPEAAAATAPGAKAPAPAARKPRTGGKAANAAPVAAGRGAARAGPGGRPGAEPPAPAELPPLSMAQARQEVAASCVLPLGCLGLQGRLPCPKAVLLYGPPGSGKTLLAGAVAHEAGALLFDLSPAATAGLYPGKQAALMVHLVFKAARALAPAVVLVEGAEGVFISDKARAKALAGPGAEPHNRIRKALLAEVADLRPGDGVLVLLTAARPQACVSRDERSLRSLLGAAIGLPLPSHADRGALLAAFGAAAGLPPEGPLAPGGAQASAAAALTAGLSAGQLRAAVAAVAARWRQRQQEGEGGEAQQAQQAARPGLMELLLEVLPALAPPAPEERAALAEWGARAAQPLPPDEEAEQGGDGKKAAKRE